MTIEKYVDALCAEVYEDWSLDVLPEVRNEWRNSVRTTLTKAVEEARREERENIIEKLKGEAQVYTGNTPLCVSVEDIDAIAHLSDK